MSALADQLAAGPRVAAVIPTERAQDVIYIVGVGMMEWVDVVGTGAFSGYRCLEVGRPEFGSTVSPRGYELDMVGGLVPKAAYASLWAWAQKNGHSVTAAAWTTKVFKFADVDATYFRLPDLRDMFPRFTGTNADTLAARVLGSYQPDAFQSHLHQSTTNSNKGYQGGEAVDDFVNAKLSVATTSSTAVGPATIDGAYGLPRIATETRPVSTAFAPRIHI